MADRELQASLDPQESAFGAPIDDIDMGIDEDDAGIRRARYPRTGGRRAGDADIGKSADQRRIDAIPWRHQDRQGAVAKNLLQPLRSATESLQGNGRIAARRKLSLLCSRCRP